MRFILSFTCLFIVITSQLSAADSVIVTIPGTAPLTWPEQGAELSDRLMDGAHAFVDRKIFEAELKREQSWNYDFSSPEAYQESIAPNRERFKKMIGLVDQRVTPVTMDKFGEGEVPGLVAENEWFRVWQVRWPVLDGVWSEGLLVVPTETKPENAPSVQTSDLQVKVDIETLRKSSQKHFLIAIPDADETPEMLLGIGSEIPLHHRYITELAKTGFSILIPTLIDRRPYNGVPEDARIKKTKQTHREWIYRQAFHMGRHIIGYEAQKILAALDWISAGDPDAVIACSGWGEGGLIALSASASDSRISTAIIGGLFGSEPLSWQQPIFRNLYGYDNEFGDANHVARLLHRKLYVHLEAGPVFEDSKGKLPIVGDYEDSLINQALPEGRHPIETVIDSNVGPGVRGLYNFIMGSEILMPDVRFNSWLDHDGILKDKRKSFSASARHDRLFRQLETHVQSLISHSNPVRQQFYLYKAEPKLQPGKWSTNKNHPTLDSADFIKSSNDFRRRFEEEAMGKFDEKILPPNARTRKILETDQWTAYDVVLDVYPELQAWGTLLMPKGIKEGERRPVVVCQHGRNGLPRDSIDGNKTAYNDFAAKLAERGFITFAAHNLYRGEDRYRWLDRKANSIGASLFSFIIPSHRQFLKWLASQPQVDPERIAFYGLSYGGESAVRIPSAIEEYCLSICSGDFNQWTRKVASTDMPGTFMKSIEWEMPYWNLGHTFDYAEMTYLIFPRPFMVERGHHDGVGVDYWVAHEYAKVRYLYAQFGKADLTEIEYFQGGHSINGQGSFDFLHKHLKWPKPEDN